MKYAQPHVGRRLDIDPGGYNLIIDAPLAIAEYAASSSDKIAQNLGGTVANATLQPIAVESDVPAIVTSTATRV